ncbi:isocitrate lyase/phosphoenolpyruvate mutase family protein, partial [Paraburkholderia sp. SIMBA_053]|uniref:isocitrate lyase/phosphoenolpyruvate mutase family protein n=1 Tax=Paraburkholderia sp. SIMBA_053 TaxID=3085794 RepID=UPI003979C981
FVIMARTDALAVEGLQAAMDRAMACVEAGADMIFPEAMTELGMYRQFAQAVKVPVLANITEFGATPLFTVDELRGADVSLVLYPLSAFRAMNKAAENVYTAIRRDGTQKNVVDTMLFKVHQQSGEAGRFVSKSAQDGVTRLNSVRNLSQYPLFVAAALAQDEILAPWWSDTLWHAAGTTVLVLMLAVFGWRLV